MSAPDAPRPKLLVIDDAPTMVMLVESAVGDIFEVHGADSGAAGLQLGTALRPNVILCDMLMPGMNGWETIVQMRMNPVLQDTPVILMSGVADDMVEYPGMKENLAGILQKPFTMADARAVVMPYVTTPNSP
jgi:CheY-like chemotaxis protein